MTVTVLVDNDVVIKLSKMDVYVDALAAIGVSPSQVGSLRPMLRYMGRAEASRRDALTANAAESNRLNAALQSIVELEMTVEEAAHAARLMGEVLSAGLDIQGGELALCVVAVTRGGLDLCTGDKRALKDLPALEALWAALAALRGRCICLEQLFEWLCAKRGLSRIRSAVTTSPRADETIAFVYDQVASKRDSAFIQGMQLVTQDRVGQHAPGWLKAF